jgi:hypothetical protein
VTFVPRLDALPSAQRALWPELAAVPHRYVLYGGTALALRFAHRPSLDFDFFAHDPLDHRELDHTLPFVRRAHTLEESADTRTVLVRTDDGDVKLSFFGGIEFGRVGEPELTADSTLRAASIADLGATKIKALLQRVEAKDYLDIVALLDHSVPLSRIMGAAQALFGPAFNPLVAQKALIYFEGGDLATLSQHAKWRLLAEAGRDLEIPTLPLTATRLD